MDPISALSGLSPSSVSTGIAAGPPSERVGAGSVFAAELQDLQAQIVAAGQSAANMAEGGRVNMHDATLRMVEASIQLELITTARDRLVQGINDLLHMQI